MCQLTLLPNVDPLRSQSGSSLSIVKYHVFIEMPLNHVFIEMPLNHVFIQLSILKCMQIPRYLTMDMKRMLFKEIGFTI